MKAVKNIEGGPQVDIESLTIQISVCAWATVSTKAALRKLLNTEKGLTETSLINCRAKNSSGKRVPARIFMPLPLNLWRAHRETMFEVEVD